MQALIYVPPGGNYSKPDTYVELALKDGYILSTVQNLGAVEHTLITEDIPGVDGTHVQGVRVEPREIPCTVYVHGVNREDMYYKRFELISKLSGKDEGWLYYKNDYITVRIKARPVLPGNFTERVANYNKCDIKFHCADPYWQSTQVSEKTIGYSSSTGLKFPTRFNEISFGNVTTQEVIECRSSADTPVEITVSGHAEKPTLKNITTGGSLCFENLSMPTGSRLVIDTTPGQLKAKYTESGKATVNAFNMISPSSVFWELKPGANVIKYSSANINESVEIRIKWYERYEGV